MPHVRICAGGVGPPASLPRPDRSRPKDYERAVVVDVQRPKKNKEDHSSKLREKCAQKRI